MSNVFVFSAFMTCDACKNAITKVLEKNKAKGISSYAVDLERKEVTVTGTIAKEEIESILQKTGMKTELLSVTPQA